MLRITTTRKDCRLRDWSWRAAQVSCLLALVAVPLAGSAWAQASNTVGGIATRSATDLLNWGSIITLICYLAGGGFAIAGVMKLFEYGRNPQGQTGLRTPIFMFIASVLLVGLPNMIGSGSQTIFGAATSVTGSDTNKMQFH